MGRIERRQRLNQFISELKNFPKKCDWILLLLCFVTSSFGCVVIASTTSADKFGSNFRYIAIQIGATLIGILAFAIVSSIDIEVMSEYRYLLVAFNIFLLLLLIPFDLTYRSRSVHRAPLVVQL